jgi:hypothetical protein
MQTGDQIAESIRQRAKNTGIDPLESMRRFVMERFIVRLNLADKTDKVVLKGGMAWWLQPELVEHARSTFDIDIHLHVPEKHEDVVALFKKAQSIDCEDGCRFEFKKIRKLEHSGDHEGLRVMVRAFIGTKFVDFHSDIGFGGTKPSTLKTVNFKSMHPRVSGGSIMITPPEFVVSEKISAIIKNGTSNTRIKDYNDLFVLSNIHIDAADLVYAINTTFSDRKQELPYSIDEIAGLSQQYADANQAAWEKWLIQSNRTARMPGDFSPVVNRVGSFTEEIMAYKNTWRP